MIPSSSRAGEECMWIKEDFLLLYQLWNKCGLGRIPSSFLLWNVREQGGFPLLHLVRNV